MGDSSSKTAEVYDALVSSVPDEARRFAAETWGETWAHAEMGSLLNFAAILNRPTDKQFVAWFRSKSPDEIADLVLKDLATPE